MNIGHPDLKVLCLGNNTQDTDTVTRQLAAESGSLCHGLLSEIDTELESFSYQEAGYYHSSVYDIGLGRLIKIGNDFDLIIMLAQPIEQWSHPDAFYTTIRVMQGVESQIQFMDPRFPSTVNYFKRLVDTNKSFCALPFIELLVDRANTTVCCRSSRTITTIDKLENFQTDPNYQIIRQKMLSGQLLPQHCESCYQLENLGLPSMRKQETLEWANRLQFNTEQDFCDVGKPVYYEVRSSNKCNLQCRMCDPDSSHLIDREYRQIGLIDNQLPPSRKYGGGFEIVDFENLKKLYIAGGEPLIMPETYEFLDRCIREKKTDFILLINTNGTKLSQRFKQYLDHFSKLQFIFSIDGYQSLNHYIRWPSDWNKIIENWRYLSDRRQKVVINTAVSIYNIHRLHELYQFIDDHFPGTIVRCQIVKNPKYLSPWIFPDRDQVLESLAQITRMSCYQNNPEFAGTIDGYVKIFDSPRVCPAADLKDFFIFNDKLDQSRKVRLIDYDPVLDSWRQHC